MLDRFQVEAFTAVDAGAAVLVAAPTGSGKTLVADHAVDRALAQGRRAFYTTPIKALSNQKFHDLRTRLGAGRVGLLTGDVSVQGDADVVVMTTEVLRNMLYAGPGSLGSLGVVVLDEVHFLQDRYRGPVWEEVIIHLAAGVQVVALSATVSNASELADWIRALRGPTECIVEVHRPIDLESHLLVRSRATPDLLSLPVVVDGEPNPQAHRFDAPATAPGAGTGRERRARRPRGLASTPRRAEVVEHLARHDLLPAIVFVFSRRGCDDAVRSIWEAGLRLTDASEAERIRVIAAEHLEGLSASDRAALDHDRWRAALEAGIAAHHAGLVPPFREVVEQCFVEGLVKVVFATETLALGINMPARSVVIETLTKFSGETHESLTPGQYAQLTGRAGRRGLDPVGRAFVLWSPFTPFQQVADLVMSRRYELRSAFRPTYNMAANLIRRHGEDEARAVLERSFAQHQADRSVVVLRARRDRRAQALARARAEAHCSRGDLEDYARLLGRDRPSGQGPTRFDITTALSRLRPGDVLWLGDDRVAVLSVAWRGPDRARLLVVDQQGRTRPVASADVDDVLQPVGAVELPQPYTPNERGFQHEVARRLGRVRSHSCARTGRRAAAAEHPVASCPDADAHLRARTQVRTLERELADIDSRISRSGASLSLELDAVLDVLSATGAIDGWALTPVGGLLVRIFHESDLLIALCLADGLFDDLDEAGLAGVVSCFAYEHRSRTPAAAPRYPEGVLRARVALVLERAGTLRTREESAGVSQTRLPEPTFLPLAHAWAEGRGLEVLMQSEDELTGGDFVRTMRLTIDLLRQIGDAAPERSTARVARVAAERLHRGVVAASSLDQELAAGAGEASS